MDNVKAELVLLETKEILDTYQIPFFLTFGTALGAYRDKGFIKHDDDIDIGIFHKDLVKNIQTLKEEFMLAGYYVKLLDTPYSYARMIKATKYGITIDLIDWNKLNGFYYHPWHINGDCFVYPGMMFDFLADIEFLDTTFKIPRFTEKYFELTYGEWRKPEGKKHPFAYPCMTQRYWQANRDIFKKKRG